MTQASLSVIKVGGSLFDWPELPARLAASVEMHFDRARGDRLVLIAGGGPVVEAIRALDAVHRLTEKTTHQLATRALDLTAGLLAALVPGSVLVDRAESLDSAWTAGSIPVLAPCRLLSAIEASSADPLPETWEVTSDTIAARIAVHLDADCLVLLKSAPLPDLSSFDDAVRLGLVDRVLPAVARSLRRVEYWNLRAAALAPRVLLS